MATTKFKDMPVHLSGDFIATGAAAPDFELVKTDLGTLSLSSLKGKRVILNIFPSLDTGVCAMSVRKFNQLAASLPDTVVLAISKDLPFAHARFCTVEGIENLVPLSDFRHSDFDENYGVLMAEKAAEVYADRFDAVTWVPVSKQRLKKRGFDQSRMRCASLCVDWHTEPQETLRKVRDNPAQSGIGDPAERRANVLGAYEPVDPDAIAGKRFLLIDDIITTGATLTECVRVLKAAGAADVVCLTLAMARDN